MSGTPESAPRAESAKRMPGPQRRRQLMATAREHFARHGFHNSTMEDIAESAKVSKPVLYQHFKGKNELYIAVLEGSLELFENQVITPLLRDMDNQTRTQQMIFNFMDVVINDPNTYSIIFDSDMRADPTIGAMIDGVVCRVSDQLSRTLRTNSTMSAEDCDFLARTLVGLATSAARDIAEAGDPEKQMREQKLLFKLAWRGIADIDKNWA